MIRHLLIFCFAQCALWGASACDRGVIDPGTLDTGTASSDVRFIRLEGGGSTFDVRPHTDTRSPDFLHKVDLTSKVEDPCTYGKCAKNLICMANICKRMCTESGCNEKTKECNSKQACMWASTFSGACLETNAKYLQKCGQGYYCEQGTLCVMVGTAQAKCLRLCKYGCPKGVPCAKTDNGCSVCVQ